MKIINQKVEILEYTPIDLIEIGGRTCYRSKMSDNELDTKEFIRRRIFEGHESILEHSFMSTAITTDRGISHELVRHRLASFSQESTRYCNHNADRFDNQISVICPFTDSDMLNDNDYNIWYNSCIEAEKSYLELISNNIPAEYARSVLPTCLATRMIMSTNYREWRHIFKMRCAKGAHPQIRKLMKDLLMLTMTKVPIVFDDIYYDLNKED